MPRIVYFIAFIGIAIIPFLVFGLLSSSSTNNFGYGGNYRRGPSFYFLHFDDHGYRGRGFNSGAYQGGGFRGGK